MLFPVIDKVLATLILCLLVSLAMFRMGLQCNIERLHINIAGKSVTCKKKISEPVLFWALVLPLCLLEGVVRFAAASFASACTKSWFVPDLGSIRLDRRIFRI